MESSGTIRGILMNLCALNPSSFDPFPREGISPSYSKVSWPVFNPLLLISLEQFPCKHLSSKPTPNISRYYNTYVCVCARLLQSCLTRHDPVHFSPAGSSVGFFRQEHWSGFPCPSPGDLPRRIEPRSPALQADSLPLGATREARISLRALLRLASVCSSFCYSSIILYFPTFSLKMWKWSPGLVWPWLRAKCMDGWMFQKWF